MKLRLLLTIIGLTCIPQALANWYEIEMLVFSRQPDLSLNERFKAPEHALQPGKALDLIAPLYQPRVADLLKAIPACAPPATGSEPQTTTATSTALSLTTEQLQALQLLLNPAPFLETEPADTDDEPLVAEPEAAASAEQFNPQTCQMEQWTADAQLLSRPLTPNEQALQLPAPALIPAEIGADGQHQSGPYLLSTAQFSLKNLAGQLKQDASKQLLLHTAWRQPLSNSRQRSHWYAGQYFAPASPAGDHTVADTPQLLQQVQQQLNALEQGQDAMQQWFSPWQFESLISLRAGRFILFDGSFYLRQASDAQPAQIEIKQQARLVLGQLNYLDHPRLGIIIQVKRFDPANAAVAVN